MIRFNLILQEEMGKEFELQPLPLDPDFKLKYSDKKDKSTYIKAEYLGCSKNSERAIWRNGFWGINV
jgi:hypothetical protein